MDGFGNFPDLILADGGITQIRAIKRALKECEVEIPVFRMVKDNRHSTRALEDENRHEFPISEKLFLFITLILSPYMSNITLSNSFFLIYLLFLLKSFKLIVLSL